MSENVIRSLSGLVYIVLLVGATLFSRESFLVLFGLFLLQTVNEFSTLINLNKIVSLIISLIGFVYFTFFDKSNFNEYILVAISILTLLILINWLFQNHGKLPIQKYFLFIGYLVIPFILLTKLGQVKLLDKYLHFPHLIIAIFILIWTNDTFAYLVGKNFGKTKLLEKISPKKTIEGFLGGVVFAMLASLIINQYYVPLSSVWQWIIIALLVSVFGTIGDLVESKFKRLAGVKDSGNIMPGHGGLYDRLDSIIFVAPFVYLFVKIIEYVS